jgi:general secretion pathway protein H
MERSASGWSLVECLAALSVVAITTAAAAPSVSAVLAGTRLRTATVQVAAALERVRAGAAAEGRAWELRVVGPSAFVLGAVDDATAHERLPAGVVFARVNSGGRIRISPTGTAENATIVVALGGRERRVTLNQRGRITVE